MQRRAVHLLFAAALAAAGCVAQPARLTVLHTNDMHASFVPREASWVRETPRPMVGGFAELFAVADSIRRSGAAVLMLDGGDVMTGNPVTEMEYRGALGGALFEMMNRIGYDAWSPGNHDLDVSQENLTRLTQIARFPTVCANLVNDRGFFPPSARPFVVLERGGLRVGIIGVMSGELYSLVNQNNLEGLRVLPVAETVQKHVDEIDPATDLIIALTHQGADLDSALAAGVRGLDVIVGAHSHTRIKAPREVNGVLIVQAGANCENLGRLELSVAQDRVVAHSGGLIQLWARAGRPANHLTRMIDSVQARVEAAYSEVIARLSEDWMRGDAPTPVGTYIAEAQRLAAHADIGFMNNHGIRKDMRAGPITRRDLFEILPFRNSLATFQLSGRQLLDVLRHFIERRPAIHITGVTAAWRRMPDGTLEFTRATVGGAPLDEARQYSCVASDYFVGEAKRYIGLEPRPVLYSRATLFDTVEKALRASGEKVPPQTLYRIEKATN